MKSKQLAGQKIKISTQKYLDIAEIKDDCVILKDGSLRAVLLVSSINFALKAEDEQNALIGAYINLLNSLEFPIQIVIQSRKLDIESYLHHLEDLEKEQTNELLRLQIADYRQYIVELLELSNIMTKRFYLVVPYHPAASKQKSLWQRFLEIFISPQAVRMSQERFQKKRKELFQRVEHVIALLNSMTLKIVVLDTQSLIELYYNSYNPDVSSREKLVDLNKIQVAE